MSTYTKLYAVDGDRVYANASVTAPAVAQPAPVILPPKRLVSMWKAGRGDAKDYGPMRICSRHEQHTQKLLAEWMTETRFAGSMVEAYDRLLDELICAGGIHMVVKDDNGDTMFECPVCGATRVGAAEAVSIYSEMYYSEYFHKEVKVEDEEAYGITDPTWLALVKRLGDDESLWTKAKAGSLVSDDMDVVSTDTGDSCGDAMESATDWASTEKSNLRLRAERKLSWVSGGCRSFSVRTRPDKEVWGADPFQRARTLSRQKGRKSGSYIIKVHEGLMKDAGYKELMEEFNVSPVVPAKLSEATRQVRDRTPGVSRIRYTKVQ